ncbi:MAG: hypothetical protein QOF14_60 [Hyphomicrobiales bacterium]|jgi:DNA-binding transcriptional ArsR family regulator|nr:hypothetical protein [Hyphomicrobiales bacterium]
MKQNITGKELRDRLLSRIKALQDSKPTEQTRIEALSSAGNRDLLGLVATRQPRSISELASLAGRLQPNVSRSLNVLNRAGLLTITVEGRASVPKLTPEGQRKARDLGFVASAAVAGDSPRPVAAGTPLFSAAMVGNASDHAETDEVQANVAVRLPSNEDEKIVTAHSLLDLNELSTRLLANWWRILYRRSDPFNMFPVQRDVGDVTSRSILLAQATGQIELFFRPGAGERHLWDIPRHCLAVDDFSRIVLDNLVRPLVSHFHLSKRFDLPIESLLRRTEEILEETKDYSFWRSAGAFGLTYQTMSDSTAAEVARLIDTISDDDARIELASAISPNQLNPSLEWVKKEVGDKSRTNSFPRLLELKNSLGPAKDEPEPWQIGTNRARSVRKQIGLEKDQSVGGIDGLKQLFDGDQQFRSSSAGEELLRGFQANGDSNPVIVVKDEGPNSTAFLVTRAVGDYLVYGSREAPIANIYSDRQAVGRAFAAEFMAPAEGVIRMIDEEEIPMAVVAQHYGVGKSVVRHQYENNIGAYARAA